MSNNQDLEEAYRRGYNTGYIKASRNNEKRKLTGVADRLFNMAQELYQAAHENETKLPIPKPNAPLSNLEGR